MLAWSLVGLESVGVGVGLGLLKVVNVNEQEGKKGLRGITRRRKG